MSSEQKERQSSKETETLVILNLKFVGPTKARVVRKEGREWEKGREINFRSYCCE